MDGFDTIRTSTKGLAMVMVAEAARPLKRFLRKTNLSGFAQSMVLKMVLAFISHTGRMTCSQAAGSVASEAVHRGQLTRFLARPRWQKDDFNEALRDALLQSEAGTGTFVFIIDATLASQAGVKTQNTYCTSRRERKKKNRRYKKVVHKKCHSFTFGLLITPSGIRIPYQIPHYTKEYCAQKEIPHRTTAQAAAELILGLPLPEDADVVVLGDTAYEAQAVREACNDRGYTWIFPANHERVYEGPKGKRPKLRSRLKDWTNLSLRTIRLRPSSGKYAEYRRISRWRVGPRQKPRVYYAYQERPAVRHIGGVQLVFSTTKPNLKTATADDVKILMTNARSMSVTEVIDLYSLRWQIELFFKELKSTLGFSQYSFHRFAAVEAWVNIALTTVLFLEHTRVRRLSDGRLNADRRDWWKRQRLYGLCQAVRQECASTELKYLSARLKTSGGINKLKRLLAAAIPDEYRNPL